MNGIKNLSPSEIEKESFAIITAELGGRALDPAEAPVIKRVIHTTADFSYADTLYFSPNVISLAHAALRGGATIVTDTQMAWSGISKSTAEKFGCRVICFMSDENVAAEAKARGVTRAMVSMEKAAALGENVIFAIGNAPKGLRPALVIAVPVGFVNVIPSKELILETDIPCIVARGRKGGSSVAAAIVNALLYSLKTEAVGDRSTSPLS